MTAELVPAGDATPARYDPLAARERIRELFKAQVMPPRDLGEGRTEPATDEETELVMAEADALGLDILAGQAVVVRNRDGVVELWRTWEGLVAIAQATGEYDGYVGPYWSDGTKVDATDEYGNILRKTVWTDSWDSEELPAQAMVGVLRKGQRKPNWGKASYVAWGTEPEWADVLDENGNRVPMRERNKQGQWVDKRNARGQVMYKRAPSGRRVPKQSAWWQMPKAPHQLALTAFKIGLKATFQPDKLRKATMAAAKGMTREERLAFARELLGRDDVGSFNDLDPSEYAEVYDGLQAQDDALQSSAGMGDALGASSGNDPTSIVPAPAEHHTQAAPDPGPAAPALSHQPSVASGADLSAGEIAPRGAPDEGGLTGKRPPAEHQFDRSLGEVTPAGEGNAAGGGVGERAPTEHPARERETGTGSSVPPSAAPSRRRVTTPQQERFRQAQHEAEAARKVFAEARPAVYRPPTNWLHTLPISERGMVLSYCGSSARKGHEWLATFAAQEGLTPLEQWGETHEWPEDKLVLLRETLKTEGDTR